jgi:hypothetical protein
LRKNEGGRFDSTRRRVTKQDSIRSTLNMLTAEVRGENKAISSSNTMFYLQGSPIAKKEKRCISTVEMPLLHRLKPD